MSESIEIRCTIFREEDPDLYAYITSLPSSRPRKRAALLRVLSAGLGALGFSAPMVYSKAERSPSPEKTAAKAQPASAVDEHAATAVVELIDASDLAEVFGLQMGA